MSLYPIALPERLIQAVLASEKLANQAALHLMPEQKLTVASVHEDWWVGLARLPPAELLALMAQRLR